MYTQNELLQMVFFDIETASGHKDLDSLNLENPKMAELWSKRCEYLRSKFEENKEKTDEELYLEKAALHSEFNRIVCISFGRLTFKDGKPEIVIKSYSDVNEINILSSVTKVFEAFNKYKFCGHSIKRFDVPVICKRLLINGLDLPKYLRVHNMKPWEMPFIDISEVWSFGAWQEGFTSLDLLSTSLGLSSPKDDIKGEEVSGVFWKDSDLVRIAEYCEKDVTSTANILLKMSGFENI